MNEPYVIGMDIGTGSIKSISMNYQGKILLTKHYYYADTTETTELDAQGILVAFKSVIRNTVIEMGLQPAMIALSSMMHGMMAVDLNGAPLSGLFLWSDTRSSEIASGLRYSPKGNRLYLSTGTPIHAMSPLCKIKWLKEHNNDVFGKAHKFISIKEYIWYHFFQEYRIDHSVASATGLFNISKKEWEFEALEFSGITAGKLSDPVTTSYINSNLISSVAEELGIPGNTPFCIGASDGCLANLGSLCLDASVASLTIGTSAAVRITREEPLENISSMPFNYILDDQMFVCGGAINNGGNIIKWLVEKFIGLELDDDGFAGVFQQVGSVPAGSNGLLFLPYLYGERAPVWDEKSSGVFLGVRPSHSYSHFARAGMEGICFALAEILFLLERIAGPVHKIKMSGGVTRTEVLAQMLADITGKTILISQNEDASSTGACYLALNVVGVVENYSHLKEAAFQTIVPNQGNVKVYRNYFDLYKKIYPAMKDTMHQLYNITDS